MRGSASVTILAVILMLAGCASQQSPSKGPPAAQGPVAITQLYVTAPKLGQGEKSLLCYGVENAQSVSMSPAEEDLTPTPARCVEVSPIKTTTYTITAVDSRGNKVSKSIAIEVGPPRARILEVEVSALKIKPGQEVSICFKARHARAIHIDPLGPYRQSTSHGCVVQQPAKTASYTVIATGAEGDTDREKVTIEVAR